MEVPGEPARDGLQMAPLLRFCQLKQLAQRLWQRHRTASQSPDQQNLATNDTLSGTEELKEIVHRRQSGFDLEALPATWTEHRLAISSGNLPWVVRKQGCPRAAQSDAKNGSGAAFPDVKVSVVGYVVQRRRASRMLLFLDIIEDAGREDACLELIAKIPNLEVNEVQEVMRAVARKDLVAVEGWVELQALAKSQPNAAVVHLQVLSVAVLRHHVVRVTRDLAPKEAKLEKELDKAVEATRVSKSLLSASLDDPDGDQPLVLKALCRAWALSGSCSKSASGSCKLRHEFLDTGEEARMVWMRDHASAQRAGEADEEDPFEHGDDDGETEARQAQAGSLSFQGFDPGMVKLSASMRAEVFALWLVQCFGVNSLADGTGVIDVAGGRGAVSFELSVKRGIPCTVVDPRPMKWNRRQAAAIRKLDDKPESCGEEAEPPPETGRDGAGSSPELPGAIHLTPNNRPFYGRDEAAGAMNSISAMTQPGSPQPQLPHQHLCCFDSEWQKHNRSLLHGASALVGMHPDQATEAIVDAALATGKPFAVVPCCVFPRLFASRCLEDGTPVVTYKQFIAYLLSKDKRIRLAFLPFVGRNKVLYMPPSNLHTL